MGRQAIDEHGLNEMQRRFAEEYIIDLCGKQAAIRAGYKPKHADAQASKLLTHPKVSAYVEYRMAQHSKRTGVTQERILRELAKIAFADATDLINMDDATVLDGVSRDDTAVIQSVKVKKIPTEDGYITEREIKMSDKVKALELLGKRHRMWVDRVEAQVDSEITIKLEGDSEDWAK